MGTIQHDSLFGWKLDVPSGHCSSAVVDPVMAASADCGVE